VIATLASFATGTLVGRISKKASYSFGIIGSVFGIILSLATLVLIGHVTEFSLWKITKTSYFEFVISPLSAYFLLISCLVWLGTCVYSFRYDDDYSKGLCSLLILTMLSMVVIILSGDAVSFLIGWESMTIASFFMILQGKGNPDGIRKAAYLFLAFGEASTVFVMLSFAGLYGTFGTFNFLAVSSLYASGPIAAWIFVTALIGFGLKMGIAPFHISEWLPIAHSSAPTNASAILSATLTLMGVYGFITILSHLSQYDLWWGWIALIVGGISSLLGALFASVSEHTKGLPAYSTIENNGLIVVAIGAYLVASHYHLVLLADFALIAALYHAFSHSISKASLFLIMGWISKVKGSFDLSSVHGHVVTVFNKKTRIVTNLSGIVTILSLAAMPALAGFVSEWMILEVLFQSFRFGDTSSQIIGILVGAISALAAGMIIVAMTKAYGFGISSGSMTPLASKTNRNDDGSKQTYNSSSPISASFSYFLILIVVIGVAAPGIFFLASNSTLQILKVRAFDSFVTGLLGVPAYFVILSGKPFGGFSPTFTAIFMVLLLIVPIAISRFGTKWSVRRTYGWFSGADQPSNPADLYNSFGYSTPIRIMLSFVFRTKETIAQIGTNIVRPVILSPEEYFVELEVLDVFKQFYDVLAKFALSLSYNMARRVMPGKLGLYLIYIMAAFIFVLLYILLVVI
jgi:hydrogenase-4 component B